MSPDMVLPRSFSELWDALAARPEARIMAGGTDLLVWRRLRGEVGGTLVCLERIPELARIQEEEGGLRLGAMATHAVLLRHALVRREAPILAKALSELGSPLIRNMATLGGNIATASPAGDTLPPLYALDALLTLQSASGARTLPLAQFIEGPGQTRLRPGEIVASVFIPRARLFTLQHFEKVGRRKALAIAVASLAVLARQRDDGRVEEARIALGSVGPTVLRCPEAEAFLVGRRLDAASLGEVGALIAGAVSPIDDVRASAAYRRSVAANLPLRLAALA